MRADRVEGDVAAGLDDRAAGDEVDAGAQLVEAEVVEHDRVDAGGEHGLDLVDPVDLDLEVGGVRELRAHAEERVGHRQAACGQHGEVVVLGHHGVRQREAVVVPAADRTAWRSNARSPGVVLRVSTMRAVVPATASTYRAVERRDAAHPLHEVEADPLGLQHAAGRAGRPWRARSPALEALAVGDEQGDRDRRVDEPERGRRTPRRR